jgi:hypothetical protein
MGDWVSEFPNDNPELFSQHPPAMSEEERVEADEIAIEVVDAFDESDFIDATLESIAPAALETQCDELAPIEPEPATAFEPVLEKTVAVSEEPVTDHWRIYVDALREVASSFGAPAAVVAGMALTLEADPVARMWRVAINGGEPDFSACAQTLDEWSAGVVASLANAQEQMIEPIRRALRSRGVCAFGLVVEAA